MLKLKIGTNYLIFSVKDFNYNDAVLYMMSKFNKTNCSAIYCSGKEQNLLDYKQIIEEGKYTKLYILMGFNLNNTSDDRKIYFLRFISQLREKYPYIKLSFINGIGRYYNSKEWKLASKILNFKRTCKNNVYHYICQLEDYKIASERLKSIPKEIELIEKDIRKLEKDDKIATNKKCSRDIIKEMGYIKSADVVGDELVLTLNKMPIYPSSSMGKSISKADFEKNPYLFKAASYIYQGNHFGIGETKMKIKNNFSPAFIDTIDHSFDDMMKYMNWSTIGFLHFGIGHFCGGEFNDVVTNAKKYGLEYYLIALEQYLTTANVFDLAGKSFWWYPIYDKEGKIVYCAGLEYLKDNIKNQYPDVVNMSYEEFNSWRLQNGITFTSSRVCGASPKNLTFTSNQKDMFLEVCKEKDIDLYNIIKKGAVL